MAKFCTGCGNPIVETNMPFCPKCGMKLPVTTPQPSDKQEKSQPTAPYRGNSLNEAIQDLNYFGNIVAGILIIIALYNFPIEKTLDGRNFSIADLTSICSNPIGIMIGGSDCNLWNMVFYGGWVIAIVFIIFGIIQISRLGKYGKV